MQLEYDKDGSIKHYYEIFAIDGHRLDCGYVVFPDFKENLKLILYKFGPLEIKTIDNTYHIASICDIDNIIINNNGTLSYKI